MKQHISPEQLNELSENGTEKLRKWWKPDRGDWVYCEINEHEADIYGEPEEDFSCSIDAIMHDSQGKKNHLPLLSIGQMIEFLSDYGAVNIRYVGKNWKVVHWKTYELSELCDALWKAVKEVLNET